MAVDNNPDSDLEDPKRFLGFTTEKARTLWRRAAPSLESLTLAKFKDSRPKVTTFAAFNTLVNLRPNRLTEILFGETLVGEGLVNLLCQIGNQITSLELKQFHPAVVAKKDLFRRTPNLKKLSLALLFREEDCGCFKPLPKSLESLELWRSDPENDWLYLGGTIPVFETRTTGKFEKLLELRFLGVRNQNDHRRLLKAAPNVEVLEFRDCKNVDFVVITGCTPPLRELHLTNTLIYSSMLHQLRDAVRKRRGWGDHLEVLHADRQCQNRQCSLDFIGRMPNLRELSLDGTCNFMTNVHATITECKKLERVIVQGSVSMSDKGLIGFGQNCPINMKFLDVSHCKKITVDEIQRLLTKMSEPDKFQLNIRGIGLNKNKVKRLMEEYGFSVIQ